MKYIEYYPQNDWHNYLNWKTDIEWDSDDYDSDYNCNNIDHFEPDDSVLVTANDLQNAIRIAFQAPLHLPQDDDNNDEEDQTTSSIISRRHRDAIDASLQLSQQIHRWKDKSSISIDWEHGVRVVCLSLSLSLSLLGALCADNEVGCREGCE